MIEERVILPTSEREPRSWRYTTTAPSGEWTAPGFDDSAWMTGDGGFGEPTTPGSRVRTQWKTPDIWARQTFELAEAEMTGLHLRVHHDEDAEVFINGVQVATLAGHTTSYDDLEIVGAALRKGRNVIAVHCRQTGGGQYIDVGILSVRERPR